MPLQTAYTPDPRFDALGSRFGDVVAAAEFPTHILRFRNQRWAERVGLGGLSEKEWLQRFALFDPLPDNIAAPIAMRYHGHQFRAYNPDIGDGRGFLYAQLRDARGRLLDLATKGSGRTPWSRSGDGRLTLKGGVREVLAAAMLEARGVYTSKAFSLVETGEALRRHDEPSPTRSAVLTRLGHSHIRIGTFQRQAYFGDTDALRALVDHCALYWPGLDALDRERRPAALLECVTRANARLVGEWLAAGFVHGVLNTDNLNVTGESFDYGPWRFLPTCDPGFTAAYFDETGLYSFARQPEAVAWACAQLAGALAEVAEEEELNAALQTFGEAYQDGLREAVFARMGLEPGDRDEDLAFVSALFDWMTQTQVPFERPFFDWFCGEASARRAEASPVADLYRASAFAPLRERILARRPARPERLSHAYFSREAPSTMVIEEVEALWAPIAAHDDWSLFEAKLTEIDGMREALAIAHSDPRAGGA